MRSAARAATEAAADVAEFKSRLVPFRPADLARQPFTMLIHGTCRSGKSVLLYDMVSQVHQRFDKIYLLTLSEDMRFKWAPLIGADHIYGGFNTARTKMLMRNIVRTSKQIIKSYHEENPDDAEVPPGLLPRCLVICDDIIDANNNQHENHMLQQMCTNYRHLSLSMIVTSQYCNALNKTFRDLVEYNIIFKHEGRDAFKFFQSLCFPWATPHGVMRIIDEHTNDYHCIVAKKQAAAKLSYSVWRATVRRPIRREAPDGALACPKTS